jgi:hypothetical protein
VSPSSPASNCCTRRGAGFPSSSASLPMPAIKRRRRPRWSPTPAADFADRQTQRRTLLRHLAKEMDRRTDRRLDQLQSQARATLRYNCRQFRAPRNDPHYAQTTDQTDPLLLNLFFLDRLFGGEVKRQTTAIRIYCLIGYARCVLAREKRGDSCDFRGLTASPVWRSRHHSLIGGVISDHSRYNRREKLLAYALHQVCR